MARHFQLPMKRAELGLATDTVATTGINPIFTMI